MIKKDKAIKAALKLHELESELRAIYGGAEFETNKSLYEFVELKDASHREKFEQLCIIEFALRNFLQQQETIDGIEDQTAHSVFERLSEESATEAEDSDFFLDDQIDNLEEAVLWSWWGPREHVQRYLQAKPLITVTDLPARLQQLVAEARQCYAFGQPNAVMALGRMILEYAITDIGFRVGKFSNPDTLEDFYKAYPPYERADKLLGSTGPRRNKFRNLYDAGSRSIHSSKDEESRAALEYIREVLGFVSGEYAINKKGME